MSAFEDIDAVKSRWFPPIAYPHVIRGRILQLVALSLILWAVLGVDSTMEQLTPITDLAIIDPAAYLTEAGRDYVAMRVGQLYGIGTHWSAPVIYGAAWIILSTWLETEGVAGSLNFFSTTALSLSNIAVFEVIYNRLYSFFQGQWWTFSLEIDRNIRNWGYFSVFLLFGAIFFLILREKGYRVKVEKWKVALIIVSAVMWIIWIFYPFGSAPLMVGNWTSSPMFPQTFYAVKTAPGVTEAFWVRNDLLHIWNTATKAATTLTLLSLMMVKRR